MIDFLALGPLRVLVARSSAKLGGPRQRRLLAVLLVNRNAVVPIDRLVDAVFEGDPPPRAEASLRTYVTRLRRVLALGDSDALVHDQGGYRLRVRDDDVDVARFERQARQGRRELEYGDAPAAIATLRRALDCWRGAAYEEFAGEWWVQAEVRRLDEATLSAQEHLIDAEMLCGRSSDMVAVLRRLLDDDQFREGLTSRLMLALYRSGRPAEAIQTYRDYRELVSEELGIDPGPELVDLEQRILARDRGLEVAEPAGVSLRGYRLGARLGTGRLGTVFAARLTGVERDYAVRVYRQEFADDPSVVRFFESDARALASIDHPACVPIFDAWREPGVAVLVMRRMTGGTLRDRLAGGPLPTKGASRIVERIGGAVLAHAERGIVHGNVRPSNVLFDSSGEPFLADGAIGVPADGTDDGKDFLRLTAACLSQNGDGMAGWLADLDAHASPDSRVEDVVGAVLQRIRADRPRRANPYVGLRAFDEPDADRFFGREALVEEMHSRVSSPGRSARLLLLAGGSGSGKSSAVRAGLLPRIRRDHDTPWLVSVMVPGAQPFRNLELALERVSTAQAGDLAWNLSLEPSALAVAAARITPPQARLLLVVDQLEELFSLCHAEDRDRFLDALTESVTAEDGRLHVVATLRADYFDRPLDHPGFGSLMRNAVLPIPAMTPADLEAAVTGPARSGLEIEPGLPAELVSAVASQPAALPALQFTLYELAERGGSRLTRDDLAALGGVAGAIGHRAEELFSGLSEHDQGLMRRVLERLVVVESTGEPTRRRATRTELVALAGDETGSAEALLETWIQARLLVADRRPDTREPTVEIAHEAVLRRWPRLSRWIDTDRERLLALAQLQQAAATWVELDRDRGALLRGARLERALDATARPGTDVPASVADLVGASVALRDEEAQQAAEAARRRARTTRRLRTQRWLLAAALVLAVAVGAVAVGQRFAAIRNADAARASEAAAEARARAATSGLIAESDAVSESDWPLALLLAAEARRIDDSPLTRRALLKALTTPSPVSTPLHTHEAGYQALAIDGDSRHLVAKDPDGFVDIIDLSTGKVVQSGLPSPAFPFKGGVAAAGGLVATGGLSTDGTGVVVYDAASGNAVTEIATPVDQESEVAFSPSGDLLAVTSHGQVRVFDTTDWEVVGELVTGDAEAVYAVSWNLAGDRVYAATGDRSILAWDLPSSWTELAATDLMPTSQTTVPDGHEPNVMVLVPVPNSPMLAATTFGGQAYLLTEDPLRVIEGPLRHENVTLGAAVDGAGNRLAVAAVNRVVVWSVGEAAPGRPEREQTMVTDATDVAFTPDGDLLAVGPGGEVSSWTLDPPSPVMEPLDRVGPGLPYFSPDGEVLAMAGFGAGVRLFDAETFDPHTDLHVPDPEHTSFAGMVFTADGRDVLVLSCPGTEPSARMYCPAEITSYDRDTGETTLGPVRTADIAPWSAAAVAASADGRWVATGHVGGTIALRDPRTLEQVSLLDDIAGSPEADFVIQVSFAHDAPLLVASTGRQTAVWDVSTDPPTRLAKRRTGLSAAFTPDDLIVTSDQNGTVHLRDPATLEPSAEVAGLPYPVVYPAFSADGEQMVTTDDSTGAGRLWRLDDLEPFGGPLAGYGAAINPGGTAVVLGGEVAQYLSLDPDDWSDAACETAGRNLTAEEWEHYFGDEPYHQTCRSAR
jgi:DNA-binding SARP family transcriptional activator/WD40 repeat protein/tRNA A-37 threonylcarbamoyl transferase component Bud32